LNEVLGLHDFEAFLKDEVAAERFENLTKLGDEHGGNPTPAQIARTLALFGCFTENVNLFSQFAILRSFSSNGRNLLPNIANIIDWSQLDEQVHAQCAMWLFNILKKEYPKIWNDQLKKDIYQAAEYTYAVECKLIDQIFKNGDLPNLTKDQLLNFMKDRINKSLKTIGLKQIMSVDKNLLKEMKWFYDEIDASHQVDFFAKRATEYTKGLVVFDKNSVKVTREQIRQLVNE
jgi:ribonucleoside-diphosphate reductase beta chain